jgi:hypothetical protein
MLRASFDRQRHPGGSMEQATLLKIARLRTMASRHGKAFDVVRFVGDRAFAMQTLSHVMDTEDEQLLLVGLEVMTALKMVQSPAAPAPVPPPVARKPPAEPPPAGSDGRYIGRLR